MHNPFVIFIIMICVGDPIWLAMAYFAFWGAKKIGNHGRNILETGFVLAGSFMLGHPPKGKKIKATKSNIMSACAFIYYSYFWYAVGWSMILFTIVFTALSFWASFLR